MRSIKILALTTILLVSYMAQTQTPDMKLSWIEEFSGTKLDTTVWSKIPRGTSAWNRYMSDYDSLYEIRDGNLILRGALNTTQKGDTATYLTAGVYTAGKKTFGHGRIEIRARLGTARGYWPAFWMLPATQKWPLGGEIDIMEHLNSDSVVYQTLHTNYTLKLNIKEPKPGAVPAYVPGEYNVYGVERREDKICFYVNGKLTLTYPRLASAAHKDQFPFNVEPFYLLLDSQLGGDWVGAINPDDLPVEMQIDWVKFYEIK